MTATSLNRAQSRPRIRAWTVSALRDIVYSSAVCAWAVAEFSILVTGSAVTVTLLVLVIGVFVWAGFVYAVRWTTLVDRWLAGWQRGQPVEAVYRPAGRPPSLITLTTDPQTWRDLAWLAVSSVLGFATGLSVLTATGLVLTYLSMPLWFWAVSHPGTEYGVTAFGLFTVDTLSEAAAMTGAGLALIPVVLLWARCCARLHAGLAARFLGA